MRARRVRALDRVVLQVDLAIRQGDVALDRALCVDEAQMTAELNPISVLKRLPMPVAKEAKPRDPPATEG